MDAKNLYGWALSERLPTHGFKWMKESQLTNEEVLKLLDQRITNHGYLFKVDLEYTKELWESYNYYPLAPEKMKIDSAEKLVGNFYPKFHYVLNYKNRKEYLNLG